MSPRDSGTARILVIRLSSLGDVVLTSFMLRNLRRKFPEAEICMLTKPPYLQALAGFPWLDERLIFDGRIGHSVGKLGRYDIVIDLQNSLASRRLTASLNPRRLFRFHRQRWNRWRRIHFPRARGNLTIPPPVALQYLQAVGGLGVEDDGKGIELHVSPAGAAWADGLLTPYLASIPAGARAPLLVVAPGAQHATKIWPIEYWVELLQQAANAGYQAQVIIGGESDRPLCDGIAAQLPHPVLQVAGKTDLAALIGIIARADLFVGGDSGPMHIAAAVGTPVVTLFGPTVPEFGFAPFRTPHTIVQVENLDCRPCHAHGPERCPRGHFKCMRDISSERVLMAMVATGTMKRIEHYPEHV